MTDISNETNLVAKQSAENSDRRDFIKGAAAAGLLSAVGVAPSLVQAAQQAAAEDPAPPKGLAPLGMLDYRFPITYESSVPAGVQVLMQYFAAFARRDMKGMAETLHFPFASYEGVEPVAVQSADELMAHAPASMDLTERPERFTDHDGYIQPGSYVAFDSLEVLASDPVNVSLALTYYQYNKAGKKTLRCQGIYAVTNNDGRWGIQLMSTIFTPVDMMNVAFNDTVETARRLRITHDLAFNVGDHHLENGVFQTGKIASVKAGCVQVFYQKENNMGPYRTKGIKNRLALSEMTADGVEKHFNFDPSKPGTPEDYAFYRALFPKLGVGNWGFVYGVLPETRVIHSTVDKAHMLSGAIRFNTSGEECNFNRQLGVVTFNKGHWGMAGSFTYVSPHDRANDMI
jgi:TAT (twin-arginine translocation) pathway signal sequence